MRHVRQAVSCLLLGFVRSSRASGSTWTRQLQLVALAGVVGSVLTLSPAAAAAFSVRAALEAGPLDSPSAPTVLSVTPD
jgi:hypothetical protein